MKKKTSISKLLKKKGKKKYSKKSGIYRSRGMPEHKSDWARVKKLSESELEKSIASDADSDISVDWSKAFKGLPPIDNMPWEKEKISVRVDKDILDWFRKHGKGYQTRINQVLRTFVDTQR